MVKPAHIETLKAVAGAFTTGITVVTTKKENDEIHAMTVSSFVSVSFSPPLILFSVDQRARLYNMLKIDRLFGVSILCEGQQAISDHFAGFGTLNETNIFEEVAGVPLVKNCLAWYVVRATKIILAGDHKLVLCTIKNLHRNNGKQPLLYFSGKYFSYPKEQSNTFSE